MFAIMLAALSGRRLNVTQGHLIERALQTTGKIYGKFAYAFTQALPTPRMEMYGRTYAAVQFSRSRGLFRILSTDGRRSCSER